MSWFTQLFRKGDGEETVEQAACRHLNLTPRWDDPADVGKMEKASGYACVACGQTLTREEAQATGGTPAV